MAFSFSCLESGKLIVDFWLPKGKIIILCYIRPTGNLSRGLLILPVHSGAQREG